MWFLCIRRAAIPRDQWTISLDQHLEWMRAQHEQGRIVLSGPGHVGQERAGMYLIRAASRSDAEAIAGSDPYTAAGHTRFELIEWEIHQILGAGSFTAAGLHAPSAAR